jgi:hypothetical protein
MIAGQTSCGDEQQRSGAAAAGLEGMASRPWGGKGWEVGLVGVGGGEGGVTGRGRDGISVSL